LKTLIEDYLKELKEVAEDIRIDDMARVIVILYEAWMNSRTIYLCGNGGSASTASHFACDLSKIGMKVHCLNDNPSIMTAVTNDSGFSELYIEQLARLFDKGDVLICISVHGCVGEDKAGVWSQNLWKAMDYVKFRGGRIIGLVGCEGGVIRRLADASIKIRSFSTPQVESWHLHMAHLICLILKEFQPTKICENCSRVNKITDYLCAGCSRPDFYYARGIVGNIEDIRKLYDSNKGTS